MVTIQGQRDCPDIGLIEQLLAENPGWGRSRLSVKLCELWDWRAAIGLPAVRRGGLQMWRTRCLDRLAGAGARAQPALCDEQLPISRPALGPGSALGQSFDAQVQASQQEIEALQRKIAQLSKNSSNSSKRPSSDDITKPKGGKKPKGPDDKGNPIGGQPGHPKHTRAPYPPEAISHLSRFGEQWKRLYAPFQCTRFHPSGSQTNPWFRNYDQQGVDANRIVSTATALLPSHPDLQRVLEAELTRDLVCQQRGLRHQQSD